MVTPFDDIVSWLISANTEHNGLRTLSSELVSKIRETGVPVDRFNIGVFAVHPEMAGYAVICGEGVQEAIEVPIRREDTLKPLYLSSPIRHLVELRESLFFDLENPDAGSDYPVLDEFRVKGFTQYLGFPLPYSDDGIAILTVCTKRPGGLKAEEIDELKKLFPVLSLLISVVESKRLAKTVLRTYLGLNIGERVLAGEILRGQGETVQAALWLCDLRDSTAMTCELGSIPMIEVLNQYFDCMAEAVWGEGGEILKFMGDAMLVIFRIDDVVSQEEAAIRSVRSAETALLRLSELSEARVSGGLKPLCASVALHLGEVVYGNIGASRRLDFTVMGEAVNLLARVQHLTGEIGEEILYTRAIADRLDRSSQPVGRYEMKGVPDLVEIFR